MHDKNKAWQSNSLAPWQLANLPSNLKGLRYVYCEGKSYLENATEDTEFFLNRPDEPRLYMAPIVSILQEVYGDIEEYSRSNKSNMDRSKRSSRRRTDSRYRSGLQKDFKFVYYEECRKMLQNIIEHIITVWAYYSRFVGTACARQIWWPWACPPDPYARCMPASSLLSSLRIASLNWPACMRRLHTGRV